MLSTALDQAFQVGNRYHTQVATMGTLLEAVNNGATAGTSAPTFAPAASFSVQSFAVPQASSVFGGGGVNARLTQHFPRTSDILEAARNGGAVTADELETLRADIARLPQVLDEASGLQRLRKDIDLTRETCRTHLAKVRADIAEKEGLRKRLDAKLQEGDDLITQSKINYYLVFAVFGMIAIIGGVFLTLVFQSRPIILLLLQGRVLTEVLSMGFLLLTIIILGSGKLLNQEGLAALLGTIAGYIFGQKAGQLMAQRDAGLDGHDPRTGDDPPPAAASRPDAQTRPDSRG